MHVYSLSIALYCILVLETNDEMMRCAHMTFPVLRNINLLTKKSFDNALTMAIEKQFVQETVIFNSYLTWQTVEITINSFI